MKHMILLLTFLASFDISMGQTNTPNIQKYPTSFYNDVRVTDSIWGNWLRSPKVYFLNDSTFVTQGANTGYVLTCLDNNGLWGWRPAGGGSVSLPLNEVGFGTGTNITSDSGIFVNLAGGIFNQPTFNVNNPFTGRGSIVTSTVAITPIDLDGGGSQITHNRHSPLTTYLDLPDDYGAGNGALLTLTDTTTGQTDWITGGSAILPNSRVGIGDASNQLSSDTALRFLYFGNQPNLIINNDSGGQVVSRILTLINPYDQNSVSLEPPTTLSTSYILYWPSENTTVGELHNDGNGNLSWAGGFWGLGGNAGTDFSTNYIGTSDGVNLSIESDQNIEFQKNNRETWGIISTAGQSVVWGDVSEAHNKTQFWVDDFNQKIKLRFNDKFYYMPTDTSPDGYVLTYKIGGQCEWEPNGGGAAGNNTEVQYNNSGALGADTSFFFLPGDAGMGVASRLTVYNTTVGGIVSSGNYKLLNGGFTTTINQQNGASSDLLLSMPPDAGSSGSVLSTDGAGNLSWQNGSTSGVYLPDTSGGVDITDFVIDSATWIRVGAAVTVTGYISNLSSGNVPSSIELSLPIASDIARAGQLTGTMSFDDFITNGQIIGNPTTDKAVLSFGIVANSKSTFTFIYLVY